MAVSDMAVKRDCEMWLLHTKICSEIKSEIDSEIDSERTVLAVPL